MEYVKQPKRHGNQSIDTRGPQAHQSQNSYRQTNFKNGGSHPAGVNAGSYGRSSSSGSRGTSAGSVMPSHHPSYYNTGGSAKGYGTSTAAQPPPPSYRMNMAGAGVGAGNAPSYSLQQPPPQANNSSMSPSGSLHNVRELERLEAKKKREAEAKAKREQDELPKFQTVMPSQGSAYSAPEVNYVGSKMLDLLGAYKSFKTGNEVLGVIQDPQTPAPSQHVHDPDSYVLPTSLPPPPAPKPISNSSSYGSSSSRHKQGSASSSSMGSAKHSKTFIGGSGSSHHQGGGGVAGKPKYVGPKLTIEEINRNISLTHIPPYQTPVRPVSPLLPSDLEQPSAPPPNNNTLVNGTNFFPPPPPAARDMSTSSGHQGMDDTNTFVAPSPVTMKKTGRRREQQHSGASNNNQTAHSSDEMHRNSNRTHAAIYESTGGPNLSEDSNDEDDSNSRHRAGSGTNTQVSAVRGEAVQQKPKPKSVVDEDLSYSDEDDDDDEEDEGEEEDSSHSNDSSSGSDSEDDSSSSSGEEDKTGPVEDDDSRGPSSNTPARGAVTPASTADPAVTSESEATGGGCSEEGPPSRTQQDSKPTWRLDFLFGMKKNEGGVSNAQSTNNNSNGSSAGGPNGKNSSAHHGSNEHRSSRGVNQRSKRAAQTANTNTSSAIAKAKISSLSESSDEEPSPVKTRPTPQPWPSTVPSRGTLSSDSSDAEEVPVSSGGGARGSQQHGGRHTRDESIAVNSKNTEPPASKTGVGAKSDGNKTVKGATAAVSGRRGKPPKKGRRGEAFKAKHKSKQQVSTDDSDSEVEQQAKPPNKKPKKTAATAAPIKAAVVPPVIPSSRHTSKQQQTAATATSVRSQPPPPVTDKIPTQSNSRVEKRANNGVVDRKSQNMLSRIFGTLEEFSFPNAAPALLTKPSIKGDKNKRECLANVFHGRKRTKGNNQQQDQPKNNSDKENKSVKKEMDEDLPEESNKKDKTKYKSSPTPAATSLPVKSTRGKRKRKLEDDTEIAPVASTDTSSSKDGPESKRAKRNNHHRATATRGGKSKPGRRAIRDPVLSSPSSSLSPSSPAGGNSREALDDDTQNRREGSIRGSQVDCRVPVVGESSSAYESRQQGLHSGTPSRHSEANVPTETSSSTHNRHPTPPQQPEPPLPPPPPGAVHRTPSGPDIGHASPRRSSTPIHPSLAQTPTISPSSRQEGADQNHMYHPNQHYNSPAPYSNRPSSQRIHDINTPYNDDYFFNTSRAIPASYCRGIPKPPDFTKKYPIMAAVQGMKIEDHFRELFGRGFSSISSDHMSYLDQAKKLKHIADEINCDRTLQGTKYLEAVLYFILSARAMETDPSLTSHAMTMYTETTALIAWVCSVFRSSYPDFQHPYQAECNNRLFALCLLCKSALSFKAYMMRMQDFQQSLVIVQDHFNKLKESSPPLNTSNSSGTNNSNASVNAAPPGPMSSVPSSSNSTTNSSSSSSTQAAAAPSTASGGGSSSSRVTGSPSISPTPSPAGSVGSDSSQSSGYLTSNERRQQGGVGGGSASGGNSSSVGVVEVPADVHSHFKRYHAVTGFIGMAMDMWIKAQKIIDEHSLGEFFCCLDQSVRPLTIHSNVLELVCYVMTGLKEIALHINEQKKNEALAGSTANTGGSSGHSSAAGGTGSTMMYSGYHSLTSPGTGSSSTNTRAPSRGED